MMSLLKEKQSKLAAVEAKIAQLQKSYDDSVAEKLKLERNIATTAGRLKRSSKLTTALADEQVIFSWRYFQHCFKLCVMPHCLCQGGLTQNMLQSLQLLKICFLLFCVYSYPSHIGLSLAYMCMCIYSHVFVWCVG